MPRGPGTRPAGWRRAGATLLTGDPLRTIGYQGTTIDRLVATLVDDGVKHLIDVRAVPLSRKPGFSKRQLAAALDVAGIRYSNLRGLGTPAAGRHAARRGDVATMRGIFARHLETDEAQSDLALARLIAAESPCCLLCFERDPLICHRLSVANAMGGVARHLFCDIEGATDIRPPARVSPRRKPL